MAKKADADPDGEGSEGDAGLTSDSHVGDDVERAAAELADEKLKAPPVEMIREELPGLHGAKERQPGEKDWENVDAAARLSAAGPAAGAPDVVAGAPGNAGAGAGEVQVNPKGISGRAW